MCVLVFGRQMSLQLLREVGFVGVLVPNWNVKYFIPLVPTNFVRTNALNAFMYALLNLFFQ